MSIVNSRSKFPSLFEKVRFWWIWSFIPDPLFIFHFFAPLCVCYCVFNPENLQGFVLRPGHENLVAMGAISTVADDAIKRKLPLSSATVMAMAHWPSNEVAVDFNANAKGKGNS